MQSRKSRDTWSNKQIWPWIQNEEGQRLTEFCQENTLVANILFLQHKRGLYTWISPDGQYQNQIDYVNYSQRCRSTIQSEKTRPSAGSGSDHELQITASLTRRPWPRRTRTSSGVESGPLLGLSCAQGCTGQRSLLPLRPSLQRRGCGPAELQLDWYFPWPKGRVASQVR